MLNIKDNIIEPIEEITFDKIDFYGSNGRRIRIDDYKEKFILGYTFVYNDSLYFKRCAFC